MMTFKVEHVRTKRDLKTFVRFPQRIYRDCPHWVPRLLRDDMATLDPARNPFHREAETRLFLVRRGRRPVGRVAAILSHAANRKYGTRNVRFGWLDMVEDFDAARALLDAVSEWASSRGMETLTGPHGFSNFDPQGMLIEGFERRGTIHATYNFSYYPEFMVRYGFEKEIDYVEMLSRTPDGGLDPRYVRIRKRVERASRVRVIRMSSRKEAFRLSRQIFELLQETYDHIYGVVPLSEAQIDYVTRKFIPILRLDLVNVALDEDGRVVGVLITMPSLSLAFQKARGRLFPFGWVHLMQGMKRSTVLDFLLVGVRASYRRSGVPILLLIDLAERALRLGYHSAESAPMLENNLMVHSLHKYFDARVHRRRRVFRIDL